MDCEPVRINASSFADNVSPTIFKREPLQLCDLLAKKIIDLDFAIDLFNGEHAHGIQKRIEEEQTSKKEIGA